MEIFTALIALLILVGLALGTFNLFQRGKRRNGALLLLGASLLSGLMGVLTDDAEKNETTIAQSSSEPDTRETAAPLSVEEQRRAEMVAKTASMTESVVATVRSHYGVEAQPLIPNRPLCREDGYCDFNAGVFRIQVFGAGLAVVEPTDQASTTDYIEMCSVVFAAISGSEINYAGEVVGLIYGAALNAGSAERDFNGVEVRVSPALGGTLGGAVCSNTDCVLDRNLMTASDA